MIEYLAPSVVRWHDFLMRVDAELLPWRFLHLFRVAIYFSERDVHVAHAAMCRTIRN